MSTLQSIVATLIASAVEFSPSSAAPSPDPSGTAAGAAAPKQTVTSAHALPTWSALTAWTEGRYTAAFAVASIRGWWNTMGKRAYRSARQLYIVADAGGSNAYRNRLWKAELQKFADDAGLELSVSHMPPGTSKWNKIEHRLFSHISQNWRGRPLVDHETVVSLIANATTSTGLTVKARLDRRRYRTKVKVPNATMRALAITPRRFHGEWNYKLDPRPDR